MRRAALILLCASAAATAQPLSLRTQGPLRELFLDMTLADARRLEHPLLDVRWTVANSWNEPMVVRRGKDLAVQELDEQADAITVSYRRPWPRYGFISTAVEARATMHWGGWSDRPIEAWHGLTGAFNYERSAFRRNDLRLLYKDAGGTAFDVRSGTAGLNDLVVRTQATVYERPALSVAARFDVKLPIGSLARATGSGGVDAGVGALATVRLGPRFTLHGMLSVSRFSNLSVPTLLQPKPWHAGAEISFEASFLGVTGIVEDRIVSPLLMPGWWRIAGGGDDALLASGSYASFRSHNQISFAVRRGGLSVWLSEDFTPGQNDHSVLRVLWVSNAPDVVIGAAWTTAL